MIIKATDSQRRPIAKDNIGIARQVAIRFRKGNSLNIEDTEEFSDACIGLVHAEKGYIPEKGYRSQPEDFYAIYRLFKKYSLIFTQISLYMIFWKSCYCCNRMPSFYQTFCQFIEKM